MTSSWSSKVPFAVHCLYSVNLPNLIREAVGLERNRKALGGYEEGEEEEEDEEEEDEEEGEGDGVEDAPPLTKVW